MKINLIEVGPRDGLQNESLLISTEDKITLIKLLINSGIKEMEATSFVHPKWIPNLADAEAVMSAIKDLDATFFVLVPNQKGYERAVLCGAKAVTFVLSATESHNLKNLNCTQAASLEILRSLKKEMDQDRITLRVAVSTVFGCPYEGSVSLESLIILINKLQAMGVKRICLCDTLGIANPKQTIDIAMKVQQLFPTIAFDFHFHDTYGRALANVYAAFSVGIHSFDGSVGGLGGCPYAKGAKGNLSTEDLVDLFESMGHSNSTGVDLKKLLTASDHLQTLLSRDLDSALWKVHTA